MRTGRRPEWRALLDWNLEAHRLGLDWALVGQLAISLRVEPRAFAGLDVVALDRSGEAVGSLIGRGWQVDARGRGVLGEALRAFSPSRSPVAVDLWLSRPPASSLATVTAMRSDVVELGQGLAIPIATAGHLIAMAVLSGRWADLDALLLAATIPDVVVARETLEEERFGLEAFEAIVAERGPR